MIAAVAVVEALRLAACCAVGGVLYAAAPRVARLLTRREPTSMVESRRYRRALGRVTERTPR